MSLFHTNLYFLSKNIEKLEYLWDKIKSYFDVIGISKSRIKKDKFSINSKGYSHESCPTESVVGGTLLYISNNLSYKPRFMYLKIYRIRAKLYWNFKSKVNKRDCGLYLSPSSYGLEWI